MAEPIITVEPPRRDARRGGLLSVAEVRETARLAASNRAQYVAEPCGFTFGDAGFCYGDLTPEAAADKTYTGVDNNESVVDNFAAFYGVECWIDPDSDLEERARSAFDLAESRHVEQKFAAWLNAAAVTSSVAGIIDAIAAAEEWSDDNYIARPILHMNRDAATRAIAADLLISDGDGNLKTHLGTPVVASGRYGTDVWATGATVVLRSPLVVHEAQTLELNTEASLAERIYGIIVDCDYVARFDFTA